MVLFRRSSSLECFVIHFSCFSLMSRIEELPDDLEGSLNLQDEAGAKTSAPNPLSNSTNISQNGFQPTLPPHIQSARSHTADEIVEMMGRTPLFMNSLEDAGGEGGASTVEIFVEDVFI